MVLGIVDEFSVASAGTVGSVKNLVLHRVFFSGSNCIRDDVVMICDV